MQGVKGIKSVFENGVFVFLFAVIKPDGNEREHTEALQREEIFVRAEWDDDGLSLEKDDIHQNEGCKLTEPRAFEIAEDVENDDGHYAHHAVIDESDEPEKQEEECFQSALDAFSDTDVLFELIDLPDAKKTEQECEHHVLMERENERAGIDQIERDFGDQSENQ
jgi:hypothetical protein